jgi:hypothetical protein
MRERPFFVVWNPEHGLPRRRHDNYPSALTEAKRLASLNKGAQFYVLVSCSVAAVRDPVEVVGLHQLYRDGGDYDDGVPF